MHWQSRRASDGKQTKSRMKPRIVEVRRCEKEKNVQSIDGNDRDGRNSGLQTIVLPAIVLFCASSAL